MHLPFYENLKTTDDYSLFRFTSVGNEEIIKVVEFQKNTIGDVYNLAMGDLIGEKIFSDTQISNNGDIKKVLTTVVNIIQIYTRKYPAIYIYSRKY